MRIQPVKVNRNWLLNYSRVVLRPDVLQAEELETEEQNTQRTKDTRTEGG